MLLLLLLLLLHMLAPRIQGRVWPTRHLPEHVRHRTSQMQLELLPWLHQHGAAPAKRRPPLLLLLTPRLLLPTPRLLLLTPRLLLLLLLPLHGWIGLLSRGSAAAPGLHRVWRPGGARLAGLRRSTGGRGIVLGVQLRLARGPGRAEARRWEGQ